MNFIDFFFIGLLVLAGWKGFKKGFVLELFTLLAFFLGYYAAVHFSNYLSISLKKTAGWDSEYLPVISFALCFLAVGAMVYFGGKAVEKVIKIVQLGLINRLFGLLFSVLTMMLLLGGIILITMSYDEQNDIIADETKDNSLLYYPILNFSQTLIPATESSTLYLKNQLDKELSDTLK